MSYWQPNLLPFFIRFIFIDDFLLWILLFTWRLQNIWFLFPLHKVLKLFDWFKSWSFLFCITRTLFSTPKLYLSKKVSWYFVVKLFCFCCHLLSERTQVSTKGFRSFYLQILTMTCLNAIRFCHCSFLNIWVNVFFLRFLRNLVQNRVWNKQRFNIFLY